MNYRDAISLILQNAAIVMLLPPRLLWLPFLPKKIAKVGKAVSAFRKYMTGVLNEERNLISQRKPGAGNLMSTSDEIFGNMFIFNSAGYETTAKTLSYGIFLFAAHPEWQQWIAEEVRHVLKDAPSETWSYADVFPRLKRCRAVMVSSRLNGG